VSPEFSWFCFQDQASEERASFREIPNFWQKASPKSRLIPRVISTIAVGPPGGALWQLSNGDGLAGSEHLLGSPNIHSALTSAHILCA
jgi:hypothetical protein